MRLSKKMIAILAAGLLAAGSLCGCGSSGTKADAPAEATTEVDYSSMVADKSEMIDEDTVVLDGMVPIEGKSLKDGTYPITVTTTPPCFR